MEPALRKRRTKNKKIRPRRRSPKGSLERRPAHPRRTKKWESDSFGMEYTEYEYNEQWLQTSETTYELSYVCDEDSGQLTPVQGEVLKGWSKEYDDKGNPVLFEQYDYEYDQWSLHEYDNVYDGQGRLQSILRSRHILSLSEGQIWTEAVRKRQKSLSMC